LETFFRESFQTFKELETKMACLQAFFFWQDFEVFSLRCKVVGQRKATANFFDCNLNYRLKILLV
jgi:hypothetical protein